MSPSPVPALPSPVHLVVSSSAVPRATCPVPLAWRRALLGLIMEMPLLVSAMIEHAATWQDQTASAAAVKLPGSTTSAGPSGMIPLGFKALIE